MSTQIKRVYDTDVSWEQAAFSWRELANYRFLLRNLVVRDLKVRYKNSILGFFWSLLNPVLMMLVYTLVFKILLRNNNIPNYQVFLLIALIPWRLHAEALVTGTVSVVTNASLIKKVYFPRVLLPISAMLSSTFNFLLAFLIVIFSIYLIGSQLTVHALWLPLLLITQMVFTLGLMLITSTIQVFYRDIKMVLDVGVMAWFFLTPVFYPLENLAGPTTLLGFTFNGARVMRWINPMASIVDGYRTVLWGSAMGGGPGSMDPLALLRTFIQSLILLLIGYYIFARYQHLFGEKL